MSTSVWRIVGVACFAQINLIFLLQQWVERPIIRARKRAYMLRLERICHPHRGVGRFVVVGGVVTLTARLDLQLYSIRIESALILTWHLEPGFGRNTSGYATIGGISAILSRGRVYGRRGCTPSCSVTRRSLCCINYLRNLHQSIRRALCTIINHLVIVVCARISNCICQCTGLHCYINCLNYI